MLSFFNNLEKEHIVQSQRDSHEMWGEGLTLDMRIEKLFKLLAYEEGAYLSMSGFVDEKGQLLSSLKRYTLTLQLHNRDYKTVGLGAVFTAKNARGQGLAQQLISRVLAEERRVGTSLALLYSDIDPSFYRQLGFVEFPAYEVVMSTEDKPISSSQLLMRRAELIDIPNMISFFHRSFTPDQLRPFRTHTLWSFFRKLKESSVDYLISKEGTDLGYLSLSENRKDTHTFLNECVIPPSYAQETFALVHNFCYTNGIQHLKSWSKILYRTDTEMKQKIRTYGIPMILSLEEALLLKGDEKLCLGPMDWF
jgi:GNAT superfamily N-acetyltransferase